jgi:Tol biopolymer transport system component
MSVFRFRAPISAALGICLVLAACAKTQKFEISPSPGDSLISVDGSPIGTGSMEQPIKFKNAADAHTITASHVGYRDKTVTVSRGDPTDVELILGPLSRKLTFNVTPVPAVISIDGRPVSPDPLVSTLQDLDFTTDSHQQWTKYTVTAARPGFVPAKVVVNYTDESSVYTLQLQPMRKDISITTNPSGATVVFDSDTLGKSPVIYPDRVFQYDVDANQFLQHTIRVSKPGYEPYKINMSWDDGKTDYNIVMPPRKKTVHIVVTPVGASAVIDGQDIATDSDGVATAQLTFAPTDEIGTLPVHKAVISKKTANTEWAAINLPIAWDDGKTDYSVTLKEIKTAQVLDLRLEVTRNADGVWELGTSTIVTKSMKDVSEGSGHLQPALLYTAEPGASIGSLAISPSGSQVLFTILTGQTKTDFRSQILAISTDGSAGVQHITDGKAVDVYPTYTPGGDQIVFASNRAGRRLNIWRKTLAGGPGIEQLTNNDEEDLWPMIDAMPKARLFYEALSDSQNEAQLYVAQVDGGPRMDLATTSIQQPRVSPKADSILFTSVNQRTGNREIYRIPDKGGPASDLTNDPEVDCYDPAWSHDGTKIAFVCNRGLDEDRNRNADIWIMDLANPDKPIQVTSNGSVDDCPVWDPSGKAIYFRSNRGGQWGIWRISLQ